MAAPPTDRMRELETLLAKIRSAGMVQLNYDMWDQHGSASASPEQRATMDAELADASREQIAAKAALEALVATTRAEAPAEIAAWADAHDAYLAGFLEDCVARGESDGTGASIATRERAEWAEVRAGGRAFVDEALCYVTDDTARYRKLFGIDPQTHERVDRP
jgi:hypothetical protein